nr:hypothetical protein GCM10020092_028540 [Actinoplanes digitatis]
MGHREDLLAGAKRCLYEKGYARTTARDIVAASGTNLGSIGYHYGSTRSLMNAAMLSAIEEWGEAIGAALATGADDGTDDPLVRYWRRVIGTLGTHRELWLASVEAMLQSEHSPELKAQIAAGDGAGPARPGRAAHGPRRGQPRRADGTHGRIGVAGADVGRDDPVADGPRARAVGRADRRRGPRPGRRARSSR